jgi:glycosyltransferase involved in cell wall biosynthesis
MKIIHLVLGKANPNRMNGVNKVAHKLAATQHALGYDASVWGVANDLSHNYPERAYPTALFLQQKNPFAISSELKRAIQGLRSREVIFHFHGAFLPVFYTISRLLKRGDIPYLYTPHGSLTEGAMQKSSWKKKLYIRFFESRVVRDAKAIHVLGIMEAEYMTSHFPEAHQVLIPNGQDFAEIPELETPDNRIPHFGFCGRLDVNHKGLDLLLQGFSMYLSSGLEGKLFFIGNGKDRDWMEQEAEKLGIKEAVHFYGPRYGAEKFSTLSQCDVFVHTSRMEGFPLAVLEAAAIGKPCLLSRATSVVPFIKKYDAGFALRSNTPAEICAAMAKAAYLHSQGQLRLMGENAVSMVQEVFNWKDISLKLATAYES